MGVPDQTGFRLPDEVGRLRDRVAELEQEIRQKTDTADDDTVLASLRRLMEDAPVGFAFLNADCRYQVVNRKLAEMNGVPAALHLGRRLGEILPQCAGLARKAFQEVIATERPFLDQEFSGET